MPPIPHPRSRRHALVRAAAFLAALLAAAPAAAQRSAPQISMAPHHPTYRNVAQGSYTYSVSTPAYVSMDQPRSANLFYAGGQAAPQGFVQFDVVDHSVDRAQAVSAWVRDASGAWLTPEVVWRTNGNGGRVQRLALRWDASAMATGAYYVTISVFLHWPGGYNTGATQNTRVLIVNERNSNYGAGWTLAGHQRLHFTAGSGGAVLTEGDGSAKFFHGYDNLGNYTSPEGDFTTLKYYSSSGGNPAYYVRRYPDGTQVLFHPDGQMDYSVDRFGNVNKVHYYDNTHAAVMFLTDPTGKSIYFSYESTGKLRWMENPGPDGRDTYFGVNAAGDLAWVQAADGSYPVRAAYGTNHLITAVTDEAGKEWAVGNNEHNELSRLVAPWVKVTTDADSVRPTTDLVGPMSAVLPSAAVTCTNGSAVGTSGCPAPWLAPEAVRLSVKDPTGRVTRMAVDRFGAPTRIEEPLGRVSTIERNAAGQVVRTVSPTNQVVRNEWEGVELRKTVNEAARDSVLAEYESLYHQPTRVWGPSTPESFSFYDSAGQLDSTRVGTGTHAPVTLYSFESDGRLKSMTDPDGHGTFFRYRPRTASNGAGNLDSTSVGVVNLVYRRTSRRVYDRFGRDSLNIGPGNDTTRTVYDALNRVTHTYDATGRETYYEYASGLLYRVRDAKQQNYYFHHDPLGRLKEEVDPAGQYTYHWYDLGGNRTRTKNRRGQVITATYDTLGRMVSRDAAGQTTEWAYDPAGLWVRSSVAANRDSVVLDSAGRVVRIVTTRASGTYTLTPSYDDKGRRTSLSYTGPSVGTRSLGFRYNAANQLDTLIDASGRKTPIAYRGDGMIFTAHMPYSFTNEVWWSSIHTPTEWRYNTGSKLDSIFTTTYAYDARGAVQQRRQGNALEFSWFGYNRRGELEGLYRYRDKTEDQQRCGIDENGNEICAGTTAKSPTFLGSTMYGYDEVGNRTDRIAALDGNRLIRVDGFTLAYDADGNLLHKHKANVDSLWLGWDALGQLTSAGRRGKGNATYQYDAMGRVARRVGSDGTTDYIYDGDHVLLERTVPAGSTTASVTEYSYFPGTDRPHAMVRGASAWYYATDHPGNVVGLVGAYNTATNQYRYDPWGQITSSTEGVAQPLKYAARPLDAVSGLYNVRARWYDPHAGRWVSEDPIGLAGGINPYAYANNNPTSLRDPSGLMAMCNAYVAFKYWRETLKVIASSIRVLGYEGSCGDEGRDLGRQGGSRGAPIGEPLEPEEIDRLECVNNHYVLGPARAAYTSWIASGATNLYRASDNHPWNGKYAAWTHGGLPGSPIVFTRLALLSQERILANTMAHEYKHYIQFMEPLKEVAVAGYRNPVYQMQMESDAYFYQERYTGSPRNGGALGGEFCPAR